MGFFPTTPNDGDEIGPNTNGTYFKYVAVDNKWIILPFTISDLIYDAGNWDNNPDAASKNAIRDKFEGLPAGHTRLHAITDVLDHSAGNWKFLYSDGSGHIIELALGADTKVLKSNGPLVAPSWEDFV